MGVTDEGDGLVENFSNLRIDASPPPALPNIDEDDESDFIARGSNKRFEPYQQSRPSQQLNGGSVTVNNTIRTESPVRDHAQLEVHRRQEIQWAGGGILTSTTNRDQEDVQPHSLGIMAQIGELLRRSSAEDRSAEATLLNATAPLHNSQVASQPQPSSSSQYPVVAQRTFKTEAGTGTQSAVQPEDQAGCFTFGRQTPRAQGPDFTSNLLTRTLPLLARSAIASATATVPSTGPTSTGGVLQLPPLENQEDRYRSLYPRRPTQSNNFDFNGLTGMTRVHELQAASLDHVNSSNSAGGASRCSQSRNYIPSFQHPPNNLRSTDGTVWDQSNSTQNAYAMMANPLTIEGAPPCSQSENQVRYNTSQQCNSNELLNNYPLTGLNGGMLGREYDSVQSAPTTAANPTTALQPHCKQPDNQEGRSIPLQQRNQIQMNNFVLTPLTDTLWTQELNGIQSAPALNSTDGASQRNQKEQLTIPEAELVSSNCREPWSDSTTDQLQSDRDPLFPRHEHNRLRHPTADSGISSIASPVELQQPEEFDRHIIGALFPELSEVEDFEEISLSQDDNLSLLEEIASLFDVNS